MKGLLLKDWYMMRKYCRAYLFIAVLFLAVSLYNDNMFYLNYPCLLSCLVPVNLLSYDERSGWVRYSGVLPYTKRQIVSSKYLLSLFLMLPTIAVAGVVRVFRMNASSGGLVLGDCLVTLFSMWIFAMVSSSVSLPLIFLFGTEKGRIVYIAVIAMFFSAIVITARLLAEMPQIDFALDLFVIGIALLVIGMYALSWYLSVVFYGKREL